MPIGGVWTHGGSATRSRAAKPGGAGLERPMIGNSPGLRSFFVRELGSWWNKYVHNDVTIWDALYRRSYGRKLESSDQRGRHYIIAGIIRDLISPGGRVLDA